MNSAPDFTKIKIEKDYFEVNVDRTKIKEDVNGRLFYLSVRIGNDVYPAAEQESMIFTLSVSYT